MDVPTVVKRAVDLYVDSGLIADKDSVPPHMELFVRQSDVVLDEVRARIAGDKMTVDQARRFCSFLCDIGSVVMRHPVVCNNQYLRRFAEGPTEAQARHEMHQFSVFGVQFDVAQMQLLANAMTPEQQQQRWRLHMNELGCLYANVSAFEGELAGTVKVEHDHKTWMRNDGASLGLAFGQVGQIHNANEGTRGFVTAVFNRYASERPNIAASAALAIETWAGNYLWKPWIQGMGVLNAAVPEGKRKFGTTYIRYHDKEEEHHSQDVLSGALNDFSEDWFDRDQYLEGVRAMLDAIQGYYESQLATMPDRDDTWPAQACPPLEISEAREAAATGAGILTINQLRLGWTRPFDPRGILPATQKPVVTDTPPLPPQP